VSVKPVNPLVRLLAAAREETAAKQKISGQCRAWPAPI